MKSDTTLNGIGSLELEAGPTPSVSPAGQMVNPSTPEAPPANPYRAQVKDLGTSTNGTSGRNTIASCESLMFQRALANRFLTKTDWNGSTEYRLTWKNSALPSLRLICQLQAQVITTSGSESSGLPTPTALEGKDFGYLPSLLAKLDRGGRIARWLCSRTILSDQDRVGLHPLFACWMMGYPETWNSCGVTAMRSAPGLQQCSSKRRKKPAVICTEEIEAWEM